MASAKTWFVKTGFGTVLGPMPTDVLREMVGTGELVRSDQVQKGTGGRWHPAGEVPGLFDVATPRDSESDSPEPAVADATAVDTVALSFRDPEPSPAEQSVSDSIPQREESSATGSADSAPTVPAESELPVPTSPVKGRLIPPSVPNLSPLAAASPLPAGKRSATPRARFCGKVQASLPITGESPQGRGCSGVGS